MLINFLNSTDVQFDDQLNKLLMWDQTIDAQVVSTVQSIITDIRQRGDAALLDYTAKFDRMEKSDASELVVSRERIDQALNSITTEQQDALEAAATRIRSYHERQQSSSWQYQEDDGTVLGQKITPLDRVGLYAPGGKAAYPSSVLMAAIPAVVAGVEDVILATPTPDNELNPLVLAAAAIAGVSKIFTIGGAQAVAAMAYGTLTVPKVDKIVGPGNIYVATAKREVFGQVDIDMIAGPSEILIVSDGKSNPDWIAMDLFSQAEHDEDAQAILLCHDQDFIDAVYESIERLLPTLARSAIVKVSLKNKGALIKTASIDESIAMVNRIAPEHLELSVESPETYLAEIRHAGAIFMGRYTSESLGDYCAGPNHVLPTSGTARFSSPLGVYDFVKRSSIIHCSRAGAKTLGKIASTLARGESLEAHARAAEFRLDD